MWHYEMGNKIAAILDLIADPPNLRREGSIKVFDGGQLIEDTGITVFELSDGTQVSYGSGQDMHLTIKFSRGGEANIRLTEPG